MYIYPDSAKLSSPKIFDTHAHYDDIKFADSLVNLMQDMQSNGVYKIITCGCDKTSSEKALALSHEYDFVYSAAGIHPENLDNGTDISFIRDMAQDEKCVAIGETGLDYYWNSDDKERQIDVLERQILLAKELCMPIIIHDRDAHEDTLRLIKKYRPAGVVHCFSGSKEMAEEIVNAGMYIGIGGVATFKNARKLPEVIKYLPEERILLETDAPYLAPEPYRGSLCHSGLITYTAQKIAEIRNSDIETVLDISLVNAKNLFGL